MAVERPLVRKFAEMFADAMTSKHVRSDAPAIQRPASRMSTNDHPSVNRSVAKPALGECGVYPRSMPSLLSIDFSNRL